MPVLDDLSRRPRYFQLITVPKDFITPYDFNDGDSFKLSITGENRMYKLRKEQQMFRIQKYTFWIAVATLAFSILIGIIGIVQNAR